MYNKIFYVFFTTFLVLILAACKSQNDPIYNKRYKVDKFTWLYDKEFSNIDKAIVEIANQLLVNISNNDHINQKVAITTIVSLDDLDRSSTFGRMISESLFNELHERKFKTIDLRSSELITVTKDGEFVLTRDVEKLKDEIPQSVTLVGTYTPLDKDRVVINTRIINIFTSDVLSTSRIIFIHENDCKTFDLCPQQSKENQINLIPIKEMK